MSHTASPLSIVTHIADDVAQQHYPTSTLYVVATPIGNICDITIRALHVLSLVDAIACEDTRNTGHLLHRYDLSKPLIAAHEHNEREVAESIIARLQQGQRIALVSDAGTPAVSDPGARIVDAVRHAGCNVIPLPGASAGITALSASGLLNDRFYFVGFLPSKARQRDITLTDLSKITATLVFYEAPHRINETVAALLAVLGPARQVVLAREITKMFETIHRCTLADAPAWLAAEANRQKGEFVVLVDGATPVADDQNDADRLLTILLAELPVKQAAQLAAQITGQKKNALYERALQLKEHHD